MAHSIKMELQTVTVVDSPLGTWSLLELFVLLGWFFALTSCCWSCCRTAIFFQVYLFSRKPRSGEEARQPASRVAKTPEAPHSVDVSAQTFLCTPPNSLYQQQDQMEEVPKLKESRATTPEPTAVYSSFRRGGSREMLTRDMVVRACPVLADMDQRREMARWRENLARSSEQ